MVSIHVFLRFSMRYKEPTSSIYPIMLLIAVICFLNSQGFAQSDEIIAHTTKDVNPLLVKPLDNGIQPSPTPLFTNYRGIYLSMEMSDVQKKLGLPTKTNNDMDYYEFSKNESVQIYYDETGKVKTICVVYTGKKTKAPEPNLIIEEKVEQMADGMEYKLVRYPAAGYWVSYNRIKGDTPVVTIMMQKIKDIQQ
jgi:hypothetical protein